MLFSNWKNKTFATLCAIGLSMTAFGQGIDFAEGSWAEIQQKAKAENKSIFVDAYAVWCGPCKWMAKNVFTDEKVGTHFNEKYVSYKFDMEKGEGPAFASANGVQAYPTLLFFNPDGELVHKVVGAQPADQLLVQSGNALDPSKQIYTLKKKFEAGERNPDFLYRYTMAMNGAYEDATESAKLYLATQKKEDWASEKNFDLISNTIREYSSEEFKYVANNKSTFIAKLGEEKVSKYIDMVLYYGMQKVVESKNGGELKQLKADIKNLSPKNAAMYNALLDFQYNLGTSKELKYAKTYLDKHCQNWQELNSVAWGYFENETDKKKLQAALGWAEKSVELHRAWPNLDTQANLLHKLGKTAEAIKVAEEAIKVGKEAGEDVTETQTLLDQIKAGK